MAAVRRLFPELLRRYITSVIARTIDSGSYFFAYRYNAAQRNGQCVKAAEGVPMAIRWYVAKGNQKTGPFLSSELKGLAESGEV